MACATAKGARLGPTAKRSTSVRYSSSRAGSPLLFGLAPRRVFRALDVATEAVGSYPTFSPLPNDASHEDVSQVFLRDATVLRSAGGLIFCGTIRDLAVSSGVPWRYQARCPITSSTRRLRGEHASGRCPDFPPATEPCGYSSQRSPGPSAMSIIPRRQHRVFTC
jgi:hypothetical protein